MGLGFTDRELYATNADPVCGKIFLSNWKPMVKDNGYEWPPNTPIGRDMWVPNVLGLKPEEGIVRVEIVPSDEETGLWYVCYDADFLAEKWLYNFKPKLKKIENCFTDGSPSYRFDSSHSREVVSEPDDIFGLHVWTDNIKMNSGDGPIPVTLRRLEID